MPRRIQLHSIADTSKAGEQIRAFYRSLDWLKIEKALSRKLSRTQRLQIASSALVIVGLKMAIPQKKLLKQIQVFENRARILRMQVGGIPTELPSRIRAASAIENFFFEDSRKVARHPDRYMELLRKGLDAIIAVARVVNSSVDVREGMSEAQWLSANGHFFRGVMKDLDLPYKIRKDTDKMYSNNQMSPFLAFYVELLNQIGRPWKGSPQSLGVVIHRFGSEKAEKT